MPKLVCSARMQVPCPPSRLLVLLLRSSHASAQRSCPLTHELPLQGLTIPPSNSRSIACLISSALSLSLGSLSWLDSAGRMCRWNVLCAAGEPWSEKTPPRMDSTVKPLRRRSPVDRDVCGRVSDAPANKGFAASLAWPGVKDRENPVTIYLTRLESPRRRIAHLVTIPPHHLAHAPPFSDLPTEVVQMPHRRQLVLQCMSS
jgi:hypothetical protein